MADPTASETTRKRRVLFIQRSIPPDHSAAGSLVLDLASALDSDRFEVAILAAREPASASRFEAVDGVGIHRVGPSGFSRSSLVRRLVSLLGTWAALFVAALRVRKPDVIVSLTDPPLLVVLGTIVARLRGCRHVHWAQDLYPQVAAAGGVLAENSFVYRVLEKVSGRALAGCDEVVGVGRCMAERLRGMGVRNPRIIPNWARISNRTPGSGEIREIRQELGEPTDLVALYSGNLGMVHDFDTLLSAAEQCSVGDGVVFAFAGDGPRKSWLVSEIARRGLKSARSLPSKSWERYPGLLAAADVLVVTLRPEFAGLVVPSKVYDAAAAGRPVLFIGPRECEAARMVESTGCGMVIPNGAAGAILAQLRAWKVDRDRSHAMGERSSPSPASVSRAAAIADFAKLL